MAAKLGNVVLNTVYSEKPVRSLKTTDHPLEDGENVSDHAESDPKKMSISGIITGSGSYEKRKTLEQYMDKKQLLKYSYRNKISNVIIENFSMTYDVNTGGGFLFDITLKTMRISKFDVVKTLPKKKQTQAASKSNKGRQQVKGTTAAKVYVVKNGDTLSGIAAKYKVDLNKLYLKNKSVIGNDKNRIRPGMKLMIP